MQGAGAAPTATFASRLAKRRSYLRCAHGVTAVLAFLRGRPRPRDVGCESDAGASRRARLG